MGLNQRYAQNNTSGNFKGTKCPFIFLKPTGASKMEDFEWLFQTRQTPIEYVFVCRYSTYYDENEPCSAQGERRDHDLRVFIRFMRKKRFLV